MTLHDDINVRFDEAQKNINAKLTPPGILPREGEDRQNTTINEVNQAVLDSLLLIADRVDALEAKSNG